MTVACVASYWLLVCLLQAVLVSCSSITGASKCPLADCDNAKNADSGVSLLETSSKARAKCGPKYLPAHFTCSNCDKSTCSGCNTVACDISKCVGKFYTQQCWCKYSSGQDAGKFMCDDDCSGGPCSGLNLQCSARSNACKPWWWCGLPPPKEAPSFLQKLTSRRHRACGTQESAEHLNKRFGQDKAALLASVQRSSHGATGGKFKRAIDTFKFRTGSFVCESGLMPPPEEDPITLREYAPGFIVFDGNSCTGGFFQKNCFCYDKFLYLRGKDPKVTEFKCDDECSVGPCGGRTCGYEAPPPLPKPPPPPVLDPLLQEVAKEGDLKNHGPEMSFVK